MGEGEEERGKKGREGKGRMKKSDIGWIYFHNVLLYHSASDTGKKRRETEMASGRERREGGKRGMERISRG